MNQFGLSLKSALWALIILNILMALGSIWVFLRMAPVIESIIERNANSLEACEIMLAQLALPPSGTNGHELVQVFEDSFKRALNNVTEKEEPNALKAIEETYLSAFEGNPNAKAKTIDAILLLATINRNAMFFANSQAKQLGYAGAWGIVFMSVGVFFVGMLVKRNLYRHLIQPLDEIHSVIHAQNSGNHFRRCVTQGVPKDVRLVLEKLNQHLDQHN